MEIKNKKSVTWEDLGVGKNEFGTPNVSSVAHRAREAAHKIKSEALSRPAEAIKDAANALMTNIESYDDLPFIPSLMDRFLAALGAAAITWSIAMALTNPSSISVDYNVYSDSPQIYYTATRIVNSSVWLWTTVGFLAAFGLLSATTKHIESKLLQRGLLGGFLSAMCFDFALQYDVAPVATLGYFVIFSFACVAVLEHSFGGLGVLTCVTPLTATAVLSLLSFPTGDIIDWLSGIFVICFIVALLKASPPIKNINFSP